MQWRGVIKDKTLTQKDIASILANCFLSRTSFIPSNEEPLLPTNKKTILRQNDKVAHVIRAIAACVQGSGMSN